MKTVDEVFYDVRWNRDNTHADDVNERITLEAMEAYGKELSLGFAEWVKENYYLDDLGYWEWPNKTIHIPIEQLFQQFLKQYDATKKQD